MWDRFREGTNCEAYSATWTLSGPLNEQGPLRVTLDDRQVFARGTLADQPQELLVDLSQDLANRLEPNGSGGMYLALHLLRRLLTRPMEQYGEVYYWGTAACLIAPVSSTFWWLARRG